VELTVLWSSIPVTVSRRLAGMPAAVQDDAPFPEQGSSPCRAATAASQSMVAVGRL
jgi:hypothetical protein